MTYVPLDRLLREGRIPRCRTNRSSMDSTDTKLSKAYKTIDRVAPPMVICCPLVTLSFVKA